MSSTAQVLGKCNTPCKYHKKGACKMGSACRFLHVNPKKRQPSPETQQLAVNKTVCNQICKFGRRPFLHMVVLYASDPRVTVFAQEVLEKFLKHGIDVAVQRHLIEQNKFSSSPVSPKKKDVRTEHLAEIICSSHADFLIVLGDRNMKNKSCQAKRKGKLMEMKVLEMISLIWKSWPQNPHKTLTRIQNLTQSQTETLLLQYCGLRHASNRVQYLEAMVNEFKKPVNDKPELAPDDEQMGAKLANLQKCCVRLHKQLKKCFTCLEEVPVLTDTQSTRGCVMSLDYKPNSSRSPRNSISLILQKYLQKVVYLMMKSIEENVKTVPFQLLEWNEYIKEHTQTWSVDPATLEYTIEPPPASLGTTSDEESDDEQSTLSDEADALNLGDLDEYDASDQQERSFFQPTSEEESDDSVTQSSSGSIASDTITTKSRSMSSPSRMFASNAWFGGSSGGAIWDNQLTTTTNTNEDFPSRRISEPLLTGHTHISEVLDRDKLWQYPSDSGTSSSPWFISTSVQDELIQNKETSDSISAMLSNSSASRSSDSIHSIPKSPPGLSRVPSVGSRKKSSSVSSVGKPITRTIAPGANLEHNISPFHSSEFHLVSSAPVSISGSNPSFVYNSQFTSNTSTHSTPSPSSSSSPRAHSPYLGPTSISYSQNSAPRNPVALVGSPTTPFTPSSWPSSTATWQTSTQSVQPIPSSANSSSLPYARSLSSESALKRQDVVTTTTLQSDSITSSKSVGGSSRQKIGFNATIGSHLQERTSKTGLLFDNPSPLSSPTTQLKGISSLNSSQSNINGEVVTKDLNGEYSKRLVSPSTPSPPSTPIPENSASINSEAFPYVSMSAQRAPFQQEKTSPQVSFIQKGSTNDSFSDRPFRSYSSPSSISLANTYPTNGSSSLLSYQYQMQNQRQRRSSGSDYRSISHIWGDEDVNGVVTTSWPWGEQSVDTENPQVTLRTNERHKPTSPSSSF